MTQLTTARDDLDNHKQIGKSLSQKLEVAMPEQSTLKQRLGQAIANLADTEKRHILDEANAQEVLEAQQAVNDLTSQLETIDRRITLIHEAIAENDSTIAAATQALRNAKMAFCFDSRDKALEKIKQDKQLRELLLAAMAAHAGNGLMPYTHDTKTFVEQFFSRILPEITEAEARTATERFTKENGLD